MAEAEVLEERDDDFAEKHNAKKPSDSKEYLGRKVTNSQVSPYSSSPSKSKSLMSAKKEFVGQLFNPRNSKYQ